MSDLTGERQPGVAQTVDWVRRLSDGDGLVRVAYRGRLAGRGLRLRYGFDGWREPVREVALEDVGPGVAVSEPLDVAGHLTLDCVVTDGTAWDNNSEADYRLWIGFDPVDAHLHVSGQGAGDLGLRSLRGSLASAGIRQGIVSWMSNATFDGIDWRDAGLRPLVWVRPGETTPRDVRAHLALGFVGLKLHPVLDDYRADDADLDAYIEVAAEAGCPVACHSAPGESDPDHIRRLAERFPEVPVILYHTYLGPTEGRRRAVEHVQEQPNLYLETSWCRWRVVQWLVEEAGTDRVLFGSDASVDGHQHYCRRPPNVEGRETYNDGLVALVRTLGPAGARRVLGDNARRLFRIGDRTP